MTKHERQIGVGLRGPHVAEIRATRPAIGWFEVHSENYLGNAPALTALLDVRRNYPVSLHGVGLSLGSAQGVDAAHLQEVAELAQRVEPYLVSEHLSWSVTDGTYLNDLLPLPYTEDALDVVAGNVARVQEALGREILIENPSTYLRFLHSTIPEPQLLVALAERTGCRLLLDVNNLFVTCTNFDADPIDYLNAIPPDAVAEIHLAGHFRTGRMRPPLLIDDHGDVVCDDVWRLYRIALDRFGLVPSLIEWDRQIPPLSTLLGEARKAERIATEAQHVDDAA